MAIDVGSCWDEAPFGPGQSNGLLCELPSGHAGAHRAGDAEWMIRGPQGEPSDAQVQAFLLEEWKHENWRYGDIDDLPRCECGEKLTISGDLPSSALERHRVRAALRAASAVTEQGENR